MKKKFLNKLQIAELLPHREPMLLIDELHDIENNNRRSKSHLTSRDSDGTYVVHLPADAICILNYTILKLPEYLPADNYNQMFTVTNITDYSSKSSEFPIFKFKLIEMSSKASKSGSKSKDKDVKSKKSDSKSKDKSVKDSKSKSGSATKEKDAKSSRSKSKTSDKTAKEESKSKKSSKRDESPMDKSVKSSKSKSVKTEVPEEVMDIERKSNLGSAIVG